MIYFWHISDNYGNAPTIYSLTSPTYNYLVHRAYIYIYDTFVRRFRSARAIDLFIRSFVFRRYRKLGSSAIGR